MIGPPLRRHQPARDRRRLVDGERPRHGLAAVRGRRAGPRRARCGRRRGPPRPAGRRTGPARRCRPGGRPAGGRPRRAWRCGRRGRRRAWRRRPRSENSRPVSSCIGRASMSPRSRIVGPGRPPSRSATIDDCRSPVVTVRRQAVERLEHPGLGGGEVEPELGAAVQVAPQRDDVVEEGTGLGQQVSRGDGGDPAVVVGGVGDGRHAPHSVRIRADPPGTPAATTRRVRPGR